MNENELLAAAEQERDLVYQLRGEIVSLVNEIEGDLDQILLSYLGVQPRDVRGQEFRQWLLIRVGFSHKLDATARVMRSAGTYEWAKPLLEAARWANDQRNNIAHSHVTYDITPEMEEVRLENLLSYRSVRLGKDGVQYRPANSADLRLKRDRIRALVPHINVLAVSLVIRSPDEKLPATLERLYERNSSLADEKDRLFPSDSP